MAFQFPKKQAILIGEDQLDFLFTLLDPHFMPNEIFLICAQTKRDQALFIQAGLSRINIPSEIWSIDEDKAQSIEKIAKQLHDKLVVKLQHKYAEPIILNASGGGSRLLSFVAPRVFEMLKCPVFFCYQNILSRLGTQPLHLQLNVKIEIKALLQFFGIQAKSSLSRADVDMHLVEVYRTIYQNIHQLTHVLHCLMRWSDEAKYQQGYSKSLTGSDLTLDHMTLLIQYLEDSGLCELNQGKIYFFSEEYRQFCAGGWIGFLIFDTLTQLDLLQKIGDLQFNLYFEFLTQADLEIEPSVTNQGEPSSKIDLQPTLSIPKKTVQEIVVEDFLPQEDDPMAAQEESNDLNLFKFKMEDDFFETIIADLQTQNTEADQKQSKIKTYKIELACMIQLDMHLFFAPRLDEINEYIDLIKALKSRLFFHAYLISYLPYPQEYIRRCEDLKIILVDGKNISHLQAFLKKYL